MGNDLRWGNNTANATNKKKPKFGKILILKPNKSFFLEKPNSYNLTTNEWQLI